MNGNTTYDMVTGNTTYDREILRGANRYGVLEVSDDDNQVQNFRFSNVRE